MDEQTIEASMRVVRLEPPRIQPSTILIKTPCVRPMREGRFNISLEKLPHKQIVHCYGMGGSGWTTLFGSVGKAIRLLEDRRAPIRVIGAGCMGLTAAVELKRLGFPVVGIIAKELYDIPSWRAAGYFAFVSIKTDPEEQENLDAIGLETFEVYRTIHQGGHPYFSRDCVHYMPVYSRERIETGLELLEARGLIPPHKNVILDFGNIQHEGYVQNMSYFMDTVKMMRQLTAEAKRLQIPIEISEVRAWDDVAEETIFDCTGLGGRELNLDNNMIPVRGHLVVFNEASGKGHMDYLIYTKVEQCEKEEFLYLFPKTTSVCSKTREGIPCQGVLGGTFIPHADRLSEKELAQLDEEEYRKMLDRSQQFFYGIK